MPTPKTYSAMMKHIAHLQVQAEALRVKEAAGVIKRVREAMEVYGITPEQLDPAKKPRKKYKPRAAKKAKVVARPRMILRKTKGTAKKRRASPLAGVAKRVKYADKNGNTWSGGGSQPIWLREQLAAGKSIDEFLVKKTA